MKATVLAIVLFTFISTDLVCSMFKMDVGTTLDISKKSEIHLDDLGNYDSLHLEIYNPFERGWEKIGIDTVMKNVIYSNLNNYKSSDYYRFKLTVFEGKNSNEILSSPLIRLKTNSKRINIFNPMIETEVETNSFKIFPNPVQDKTINIVSERPKAHIQSLKVIDMSGLTIFEVSSIEISGNYNLHLPNISRGAYIIQINTPEKIETKKLIIE